MVNLGSYIEPSFTTEFVPRDRNSDDQNGETVRIAKLGRPTAGSYTGKKRYTIEYTPDKIKKYYKFTEGVHGKDWSTVLIKEGEPNPAGIKDLDRFAKEDFDTLWREATAVKPMVDVKELVGALKGETNTQEHEPYS